MCCLRLNWTMNTKLLRKTLVIKERCFCLPPWLDEQKIAAKNIFLLISVHRRAKFRGDQ